MNKIFKVIWSKARNCYVVVSELAKSHDDGHVRRSRSGCARKAAVLTAFVLTTSLLAVPDWAQAATATNTGNPSAGHAVNIETNESTKDATDNSGTLAQGSGAYATYDSQGNLIMGKDNEVVPIQKDPNTGNARVENKPENVVMGTRNGVGKFTHSKETKKPISGDDSYAYQKLDTEWITVKVYNPNTNTYDDKQVEVYKLTPGQYMDDEYNVRAKSPTLEDYNDNQEAYTQALNVYNSVANYLNDDRTRQSYYVSGATAVGVDNVAEGDRSTAIGNKAKVLNSEGSYYVDAYGRLTRDQDAAYYYLDEQGRITTTPQYVKDSNGQYVRDEEGNYIKTSFLTVPRLIDSTDAVAIGSDVTAEGRSAVAIGHQSYAKEYSVAIGENSVTDYMGVAIGKDNKAKYASTAIGHTNDANGYYTATMGGNNTARGDYSSAIGYQNTVDAIQTGGSERKANQSHALGSYNTIKGDYNLAAGDNNSIDKISGMAVGVGNKISMDHNPGNSTPINLDNQSGDYSIAVGLGNKSEKNALVIGKYSSALHDGSIAIGNSVNAQSNNNNGATDSIAIGTGSQAMTKDSIAFGHEAKIGNNNSQGLNGAIAIGKGADAENGQSLAIGYEAYTGNNRDVATNKDGSIIAIGTNAQAMAGYDIAIGAKASTASSKTSNSGGSAVAIGYNAVINDGAQRSVAMGANASVALNVHDAVALGSQSYVEQNQGANHQGGYDPSAKGIAHGDANSSTKDPVWNSTLGPISVGKAHWDGTKTVSQQTRQITNVAAGKEDTDAVNVAQLKQVVNLVNNSSGGGTGGSSVHDYSVKSVNPGTDTNYNNGGASGDNALAAGVSASATGAHSVAVGNGATAKGQDSIALGTGAVADGIGATAIGQYNTASGQNSLAFGGGYNKGQKGNTASGVASVAFGEGTQAIAEGTLAFGENTQAGSTEKDKQGNPLGQNAVAFGNGTKATGGRSLAFGERTVASANDATAFGNESVASNMGATAFGNKNQATGQYATAWGGGDKTVGGTKIGTVASGTYATAFGERTEASGESATAFGSDSTASGKNSLAFGEKSTAAGDNSLAALGGQVTTSATNAAAIGKNAQATFADSVALGSNSVTTRAKYNDLTDEKKKAVYIKGDSTGSAWEATDNAIAVGNDSKVTRQITGVAAGSLDTDAVNVAQLKKVQNLAGKHTEVTVEGGTAAGTADYAGENLKLKVKDDNGQKTYDLKLSDKLSIGGKDGQDGHIGVNGQDGKSGVGIDGKDGISIKGKDGNDGVTIKGIDGKDGVNGAEGHIGLNGKDGMTDIWTKPGTPGLNGQDGETMTRIVYKDPSGQEHEAATLDDGLKFGGDFGNASAVKLDKQVNVKGNAKKETDLTDGNIGVVSSQDGENGQLLVKLNKDLNLGNNGSVTMGNTTIDNGGVTIKNSAADTTKNVSLTNAGLDNGGNKITNVAAGEISATSTDAVNGSQLNTVKTLAGQHTTVEAGSKNISVTESTNDAGGKKYTVDLAKDVTFGDAAKGDKTVAISGTNGTITAGTGDNKVTVDGSKGQIVAGGDHDGVKVGNIANGDGSLTIYDKDGKATDKKADGGKFVTNLGNKTWNKDGSYVSGRAATEDQLHQVESNVNKQISDVNTKIDNVDKHHTEVTVNGGTAAKADGSYTDGNLQIAQKTGSDGQKIYDLKLSDNLNIGGVGKDGAPGKDGHMGINGADGKSGVGIDGQNGISIKGKDGQNGVTIKGVDGKDGTEGHIGLTGPKGADGQNATADIHVKNGQVGVDGTDGHGGKDGMDRVVYEDHNHITHEVATMDDGMKYSGDSGNAAVKLNKNVQIYGGATEYADGNNIGVVASQDGDNAKLQVKLAKDIKGINSIEAKTITTGDTTINNSGLTIKTGDENRNITVQDGNVNMGGNQIHNVAPGQAPGDAVNVSQLNATNSAVNKLGNRINRVGAGAAALAALHPLDFDPDDKWDFAAGYGNYRGANAAAIGAYYRPNEDTMFSVGGSFGGGENMVNAGVSIKLGQGNHVSTSRVAMAKEMKAMRQHMAEQDALIAKLQSMHGMAVDPAKSVLFPDVAENHWAYQYVTTLAKKGILEGYPDGEFKGDRMMTRYEFAAIVYRIVESGVGSTDPELSKLVKEFSPELQYIRIDTIQKDRNGKPTIERVRVISDAK